MENQTQQNNVVKEEPKIEVLNKHNVSSKGDATKVSNERIKFEAVKSKKDERQLGELEKVLIKAKESDGYLVMISVLNKGNLDHFSFTNNYDRRDIMPSIDEQAKNLEPEVAK